MEAKWVLTSGQKKIRFRNFLKKRKSDSGNTQEASSDNHEGIQGENTQALSSIPGSPNSVQSTSFRGTRRLERHDDDTSSDYTSPAARLFRSNSTNEGMQNHAIPCCVIYIYILKEIK